MERVRCDLLREDPIVGGAMQEVHFCRSTVNRNALHFFRTPGNELPCKLNVAPSNIKRNLIRSVRADRHFAQMIFWHVRSFVKKAVGL